MTTIGGVGGPSGLGSPDGSRPGVPGRPGRPGRPTPSARRRAFDPRLAIGLALVLLSVAGVVGIVAASDATTPVLVARSDLVPGDRVRAADLVQRNVVLDGAAQLYAGPTDIPDAGLVVTRPVADGEFLPLSAVGELDSLDAAPVVIEVAGRPSSAIRAGAAVDIWAAGARDTETEEPPAVLAGDSVVVEVVQDDGFVASGTGVAIEVLVPRDRVARVLQAVADGRALSLVPTIPGEGG